MCFSLFLICDSISWQWLPPLQPLIPLFETAIKFILKLIWSILHLLNYDLAYKLRFHRHPISGQEMVWMWYFYSRGSWLLEIKKIKIDAFKSKKAWDFGGCAVICFESHRIQSTNDL